MSHTPTPPTDGMVPTFFVLGAAKCGTTALQYYLSQHPDVLVSAPEETRFFDSLYGRGMDYYRRTFFQEWRGQAAVGEATPHYLLLPFVAERIRRECPEARHVVMVREPASRAFSHWWMEWTGGRETLRFDEAMDRAADEIERGLTFDAPDGEERWGEFLDAYLRGGGVTWRSGYLAQGFYATQIERYRALFGADRVRVVFQDDLARDPESVVRDLWRFLGVDAEVPLGDRGTVNQASTRAGRRVERLLGATGLQHLVPRGARVAMKRLLARLGTRESLPDEARRRLADYYAPHTRRLAALTGRDLSSWEPA